MSNRRDAVITKATPNPSDPEWMLVTIRCPICGSDHHHGAEAAGIGPAGDHRVAHCVTPLTRRGRDIQIKHRWDTAGGYYLIDPNGLIPKNRTP